MRLYVCILLLFVCLAILPAVHTQNKNYKQSEINKRDTKTIKEKFSTRKAEDEQKYRKTKSGGEKLKHKDEEDNETKSKKSVKNRQEDIRYNKYVKEATKKYRTKNWQSSEEDDNEEESGSNVCIGRECRIQHSLRKYRKNGEESYKVTNTRGRGRHFEESGEEDNGCSKRKRGQKCEEFEEEYFSTKKRGAYLKKFDHPKKNNNKGERNVEVGRKIAGRGYKNYSEENDDTEENYSDEDAPVKKRITYIKKFDHEKKKKNDDKELENIMRIHKKSDRNEQGDDDEEDDSSEEHDLPKRRKLVPEDEDE